MLESVATEKGLVLMGEAANAYVRYCYFKTIVESVALVLALGGLFILLAYLFKRLIDEI
jgi:hypothetical protein